MRKEKSCGCIVLNDKNEILLVKHNAGHWGVPKGHVEHGESEEDTARREVKEETNIDVIINKKFRYSMEYSPKENVMKEVVLFLAKNINKDVKPQFEEVEKTEWIEFNKAIEIIEFENTKNVLKQLREDLKEAKKC